VSESHVRYTQAHTSDEDDGEYGHGLNGGRSNTENSPIITRREHSSSSIDSNGSLRSFSSLPNTSRLTSESRNVRMTVASETIAARTDNSNRRHGVFVYIQTLLQLPPAIAALVVVPLMWKTEHCSQPLNFWAIVYAITLVGALFVSWTLHLEPESETNQSPRRQFAENMRRPLENFALGWLIMGQVWVQSAEECQTTAPVLFSLCFWLVVIGFCYFLLPCIIIILMLPFLCFCLPCVIRVLARFAGPDQLGGKGAPQDIIDALPKKKYNFSLFEDEEDPQCTICLSPYEEGQEIRFLPCDTRHHFHQDCVDEWLLVNATCPICRARIIPEEQTGEDEGIGTRLTSDLEQGHSGERNQTSV